MDPPAFDEASGEWVLEYGKAARWALGPAVVCVDPCPAERGALDHVVTVFVGLPAPGWLRRLRWRLGPADGQAGMTREFSVDQRGQQRIADLKPGRHRLRLRPAAEAPGEQPTTWPHALSELDLLTRMAGPGWAETESDERDFLMEAARLGLLDWSSDDADRELAHATAAAPQIAVGTDAGGGGDMDEAVLAPQDPPAWWREAGAAARLLTPREGAALFLQVEGGPSGWLYHAEALPDGDAPASSPATFGRPPLRGTSQDRVVVRRPGELARTDVRWVVLHVFAGRRNYLDKYIGALRLARVDRAAEVGNPG